MNFWDLKRRHLPKHSFHLHKTGPVHSFGGWSLQTFITEGMSYSFLLFLCSVHISSYCDFLRELSTEVLLIVLGMVLTYQYLQLYLHFYFWNNLTCWWSLKGHILRAFHSVKTHYGLLLILKRMSYQIKTMNLIFYKIK